MLSTTTLYERIRQQGERDGWIPDEARLREKTNFSHYYPPATENQLASTETALGFPLPTVLRSLYSQVANGGFGPGFGIIGALGGFSSVSVGGNIVDAYAAFKADKQLVIYTAYRRLFKEQIVFDLPNEVWSANLLPLCDWGCLQTSFLDIHNSYILRGAPTSRTNYVLRIQASSLEEWLELWLQDKL